ALALTLANCGYIGETLPPALNLPVRIADLAAVERGSNIIIQFSIPKQSTEGLVLKQPPDLDLRIGPTLADAKRLPNVPNSGAAVRYAAPAEEWYGKDVVIGVKALNSRGRDAGWSNLPTLSIVPAVPKPSGLILKDVPSGVQLNWQSPATMFRVYRRDGPLGNWSVLASPNASAFDDIATDYGKTYTYFVQALAPAGNSVAESEPSDEETITPKDTYAPAVPMGLGAVVSTKSIELVWDRNTESDLAGYWVYRALGAGPFERVSGLQESPSFSDSKVEPGKHYRYAVSSVDRQNNESKQSAPVEATAP
ncbi:MAG: fibronectin type III domain-containing protein, partial [Bryobacteraceae bacterium]